MEAISLRARSEGIRIDTVLQDDPAHFTAMGYVASQSDVCLVFVSLFLVENWDRDEQPGLRLDKGGEEMINAVEKRCAGQVVVVMHIGGQVVVEDWVSHQEQREGRRADSRSIYLISELWYLQVIRDRRAVTLLWTCSGAMSTRLARWVSV
jgi:hypothetical protein